MAAFLTTEVPRHPYSEVPMGFSPSGLERLKLERLRELRAVIDSLRAERGVPLSPDAVARFGASARR